VLSSWSQVHRTDGGQAEAGEDLEHLVAPLVAMGRVLLRLLAGEKRSILLGGAFFERFAPAAGLPVSRGISLCAVRLVVLLFLLLVTAQHVVP
jgi:hypothetical protein